MEKRTVCFKTKTDVEWHDVPLYFKAAPEPSNIMWENQYWPKKTKIFRNTITFLIVLLILLIQVTMMFYINKKIAKFANQYPLLDCKEVSGIFGDSLQKFAVL